MTGDAYKCQYVDRICQSSIGNIVVAVFGVSMAGSLYGKGYGTVRIWSQNFRDNSLVNMYEIAQQIVSARQDFLLDPKSGAKPAQDFALHAWQTVC